MYNNNSVLFVCTIIAIIALVCTILGVPGGVESPPLNGQLLQNHASEYEVKLWLVC